MLGILPHPANLNHLIRPLIHLLTADVLHRLHFLFVLPYCDVVQGHFAEDRVETGFCGDRRLDRVVLDRRRGWRRAVDLGFVLVGGRF